MVGDLRQGWTVFVAMAVMFVVAPIAAMNFEQQGNPQLAALGVDQAASATAARRQHGRQGGALRHRRVGAVRHHHHRRVLRRGQLDARLFTPLGGLVPLVN